MKVENDARNYPEMSRVAANREQARPRVSVVLPVYNGERFLQEAIESILSQTFTDFELLILDDGSEDRTPEIIGRYMKTDTRVVCHRLQHIGLTAALNFGLERARGDLVARMDADDIAFPERIDRQFGFMSRHPEVTVLGTYAEMIGATGKAIGLSTLGPTSTDELWKQTTELNLILCHPSVMMRHKVVLSEGGYSADYTSAEDFELWNRLAIRGHIILTMPETLLKYRVHDSSTGTQDMRRQAESTQFAVENLRRERDGLPPLTRDEFVEVLKSRPIYHRVQDELRLYSRSAYRRAGARLASGDLSGIYWLVWSFFLGPSVGIERLRRQRVLGTFSGRFLRSKGDR